MTEPSEAPKRFTSEDINAEIAGLRAMAEKHGMVTLSRGELVYLLRMLAQAADTEQDLAREREAHQQTREELSDSDGLALEYSMQCRKLNFDLAAERERARAYRAWLADLIAHPANRSINMTAVYIEAWAEFDRRFE